VNENQAFAEMPRYKCHKEVWALKIAQVRPIEGGGATITPEDKRYAPFMVDAEYTGRCYPHEGGYFVQYKDGYKSFSPAKAFEEGYTLVT
jgi:hypothetical protein